MASHVMNKANVCKREKEAHKVISGCQWSEVKEGCKKNQREVMLCGFSASITRSTCVSIENKKYLYAKLFLAEWFLESAFTYHSTVDLCRETRER